MSNGGVRIVGPWRASGSASALELRGAAPSAPSPRRRPIALSGHPWGEGDAEATELQGLGGPGSVEASSGRKLTQNGVRKVHLNCEPRHLHANVTRNHRCPDMEALMQEVTSYLRRRNRAATRRRQTRAA